MSGPLIMSHPGPLPTMPGMNAGIVACDEGPFASGTVQCAVCWRTFTDLLVLALDAVCYRPDAEGEDRPPYRRCPDCRAAHRHPPEQLDLLTLLEEGLS